MSGELLAVTVPISMLEGTERTPAIGGDRCPDEEEKQSARNNESDCESEMAIEIESPTAGSNEEEEDFAMKNAAKRTEKEESKLQFLVQICLPFLLAGFGMVGAGILLDKWKEGEFLRNVPEAIVLIPALLGLKGNLEMTMASRLSTMAHLGQIDRCKQKWRVFYSNLAVDQAQAIVVSLFASLFAIGTQLLQGHSTEPSRALCLVLASALTATVTSLVLASLMLSVTFAARALRLNPDNISTPIAAALGDLTSLASLVLFGTLLYPVRQTMIPWLALLLALLLSSSLLWMWVAWREENTRAVLKFAWFPVLAAMFLSTAGGAVLQNTITKFAHIGLFQPLINGVGGNLVAVQSSKISTHLFRSAKNGHLPAIRLRTYMNPARTFNCKERESRNALILVGLALPGYLLFLGMIFLANWAVAVRGGFLGASFVLGFLAAAILQVALLLYICQLLCRVLWLYGMNPDINSIPLLTALGDLFGSVLLAAAFGLHSWLASS